MANKRSGENEYRVTGSVLDELGLDRQAALELKLKAALHQGILQLAKRRRCRARDLERILRIQQPRVSELMRGKLSTLSVARLLLYADLLGARAEVKLKEVRSRTAA
ncbi:MAG: helix-turn-helix domain-containing protein [Terriglobales bacterium]|jgi:predicted XRE-type DNA-binding protein